MGGSCAALNPRRWLPPPTRPGPGLDNWPPGARRRSARLAGGRLRNSWSIAIARSVEKYAKLGSAAIRAGLERLRRAARGVAKLWPMRVTLWAFGGVAALVAMLYVGLGIYQAHRISKTDEHLRQVIAALVNGEDPQGLVVREHVDAEQLTKDLKSGYQIEGHDDIVYSFDDYEVFVRTANGPRYNFDVFFHNGEWSIWCCSRSP